MIEESNNNFHIAGIVPISNYKSKLNFQWHDSLTPVGPDFTAIERAVWECACAGAKTIWIICEDDFQPLIKKQVGEWLYDPVNYDKAKFTKYPSDNRKKVPIFYAPIHPRDRDRRSSYGWGALHGALTSFICCSRISKWTLPTKYYVSFPFGVYNPECVLKHRDRIRTEERFFISHQGKTVSDNCYLGFTLTPNQWKNYVYQLKKNFKDNGDLPLAKIFNCGNIDKDERLEIDWYYDLGTWESWVKGINNNSLCRPIVQFQRKNYGRISFE